MCAHVALPVVWPFCKIQHSTAREDRRKKGNGRGNQKWGVGPRRKACLGSAANSHSSFKVVNVLIQ